MLPPVQTFYLLSTLVILPLAWMRGGHPERQVAAIFILTYAATPVLQNFMVGRVMVGAAIIDVLLLGVLISMSLTRDRWWLLIATAAQALIVIGHVILAISPRLTTRESVGAQWVFGLISLYALLAGVGERWLAGEPAAAPSLSAGRRSLPT